MLTKNPSRSSVPTSVAPFMAEAAACATLDELLDLAGRALLPSGQVTGAARADLRHAIQLRRLVLCGLDPDLTPLREAVGPRVKVVDVTLRTISGQGVVDMVLAHPRGRMRILVRRDALAEAAVVAPGAIIRFSARPVASGLEFWAHRATL
ncbi:MAG: hypothetical protein ACYCZN_01155 [Candidatus Dormibacteria bacterium]